MEDIADSASSESMAPDPTTTPTTLALTTTTPPPESETLSFPSPDGNAVDVDVVVLALAVGGTFLLDLERDSVMAFFGVGGSVGRLSSSCRVVECVECVGCRQVSSGVVVVVPQVTVYT